MIDQVTTKRRARRMRRFLVERRPRLTRGWTVEVRTAKLSEAREIVEKKALWQRLFAEFRVRQEDTVMQ